MLNGLLIPFSQRELFTGQLSHKGDFRISKTSKLAFPKPFDTSFGRRTGRTSTAGVIGCLSFGNLDYMKLMEQEFQVLLMSSAALPCLAMRSDWLPYFIC